MKKIVLVLVLVFGLFILCSCGDNEEPNENKEQEEVKEYTVSFLDSDNSVLDSVKVKENEKVTATTKIPTKEDYTFDHWDFDFNTTISSDISIKPVFKKSTYFVSFYVLDELVEKVEISKGDALDSPAVNVEGYRFDGWSLDISGISSTINSDIRVDAVMTKGYKVLLLDKYGKEYQTVVSYSTDDLETVEKPVVPYHNFIEWIKVEDKEGYDVVYRASYELDNSNLDKTTAGYWIRQNSGNLDVKEVLFTLDEINKINKDVICAFYDKTKVVDVRTISETKTGSSVKSLIEGYSNISSNTVYNEDGSVVSDKTSILNNRALSVISDSVTVKFGIITDFCRLRSYPTNCYSKNKDSDQFQETSLNIGEGVAIYHTSLDGLWYFVQVNNYNGWIEAKNVGTCSKDEMVSFLNAEEKVVIIANFITISGHHVRMGQAFPLKRMDGDNAVIKFPVRSESGTLDFSSQKLTNKDDYSLGYLPYTIENILIQGFKIYGMSYSWGDKYESGRDCSSTQNAVLACFGFSMPRNTSNQRSIPTYSKVLSGITGTTLKNDYRPGTLIFSSGHVMMYIGCDENDRPYILHNTTGGGANKCIIQNFNDYTNKIIASLELKKAR